MNGTNREPELDRELQRALQVPGQQGPPAWHCRLPDGQAAWASFGASPSEAATAAAKPPPMRRSAWRRETPLATVLATSSNQCSIFSPRRCELPVRTPVFGPRWESARHNSEAPLGFAASDPVGAGSSGPIFVKAPTRIRVTPGRAAACSAALPADRFHRKPMDGRHSPGTAEHHLVYSKFLRCQEPARTFF